MGPNFNLTKWADSWLKTSGVNIFDPIVEMENGYLKSMKIR